MGKRTKRTKPKASAASPSSTQSPPPPSDHGATLPEHGPPAVATDAASTAAQGQTLTLPGASTGSTVTALGQAFAQLQASPTPASTTGPTTPPADHAASVPLATPSLVGGTSSSTPHSHGPPGKITFGSMDPIPLSPAETELIPSSSGPIAITTVPSTRSLSYSAAINLTRAQKEARDDHSIVQGFLQHLKIHYPAQPLQLWRDRSSHIKIKFSELKAQDKKLAYAICNLQTRLNDKLKSAARQFLSEYFISFNSTEIRYPTNKELESYLAASTAITFDGIPTCISSLRQYLNSGISAWETVHLKREDANGDEVFYELKVPIAQDKGRYTLKLIMNYIIHNFQNMICWNGNWDLDNWEIIDKKEVLLTAPTVSYSRAGGLKDLSSIVQIIMPMFYLSQWETVNGQQKMVTHKPVICQQFEDELTQLTGLNQALKPLIEEDWTWFFEYIPHHPFLMSYFANANLLCDLHYEFKNNEPKGFKAVFADTTMGAWTFDFIQTKINTHLVLDKVFWFEREMRNSRPTPYANTLKDAVKLNRHIIEHGLDHTKDKKKGNVQTMKNCKRELMALAAHKNEKVLPLVIRLMLQHKKMTGRFRQLYEGYKAQRNL